MSETPMTPEQRAAIVALLADAKPATDQLLFEVAQQVRDRSEHDHTAAGDWDWYCLNASGWLGDKAPTVLRRLLDAEARVAELETEREKLVRWHDEDSATINRLVARVERRRAELVALRNDALSMRGSLAPADGNRQVPFELGETLTPAVDWLIARVAELETERHTTNEALDDAVQALREAQARLAEYERPADEDPIRYALTETAPLTVFRASHDSIVMGLYTTREAAQAHCEAKVQQEEPAGSIRHLSWSADDIGPDAEYELHITPAETGGLIRGTGYMVTPLEAAAAYDPDGDE